ncbi:phospholipase D-like domain-containing protein [Nonomuraea sp. NPDC048826]|uniref:phospholipase D-like domain-containing protein n=1 Tax=Nonomuraea sp. NPDC048826 TaxID=3364347 RepID=UPI00371ABD15
MKKIATIAALCLAATLLPASGAAADVTGPPVLNAPVFNDPVADSGVPGTPSAAQSAVMDQLIRLIRAARPGSEIRFVNHQFSPGQRSTEVADALVQAHQRGVQVKVILDDQEDGSNDVITARLRGALGTDEGAGSYVLGCEYPSPSAVNRGCIGRNYLHSKFALFSGIEVNGTTHGNVVFQTSSNLSDWYLYNSYNDAMTFTDAAVYTGYRKYFDDLREGRKRAVNPGYFWTTPTGSAYRATFFPRVQSSGDPIANILKLVKCRYQDEDGVYRQTDIRLVLTHFNRHRLAIAKELTRLRGENCWVDLVYYKSSDGTGNADATIRAELAKTVNGRRVQVTPCRFAVGSRSVVPHLKLMMTDGFYDDDITPRVYTGSANFTHLENADDAQIRISGRDVHTQYLSYFYKVRDTCRART